MKEQLDIFYKEYEKLSEKDIEKFKIMVNKLINVNYLTAYNEEDKTDYYYIYNNLECFQSYFSLSGRELVHYSSQRTFVLASEFTPKISLSKSMSIILLMLRYLYTQKIKDISLDNHINVTIAEIQEKYEQLAISTVERLKMSELSEGLKFLKKHNIIGYKGNDYQNDDFVITIYPTIQYAVGLNDIKTITDKINSYTGKEDEYEETEED